VNLSKQTRRRSDKDIEGQTILVTGAGAQQEADFAGRY